MKKINDYNNKNVLVLGLGKTGTSVAKLLLDLEANVVVNDMKAYPDDDPDVVELRKRGAKVITGEHPLEIFEHNIDVMFKNPGINYENVMVKYAVDHKIPVLTEPELAYEVCEGEMIGITGTNGKTTTTTLISLILQEDQTKHKVYTGGNIGVPLADLVKDVKKDDYLVSELSSFQLMGVKDLKPKIAVLNNVYSAHLDYHKTRENYIDAKMNITKNQTEDDYFVVNFEQDEWIELSKRSKAQIIPFSKSARTKDGSYMENEKLYYKDEYIMDADDIKIPGEHNIENALAAIAVTKILGRSNEDIKKVLTTFSGVKHRIQYVKTVNGIKFYNDSKATNVKATQVALGAFKQPIVWIGGGLDRGNGFDDLIPYMKNVRSMVVYGETADKLEEMANKANIPVTKVETLNEAVPEAYDESHEGDVVLFSPAAASWDQFDDFEQRGDVFINEVEKL